MSRKIEIPNLANLLRRYIAGEPEQKLAAEAGVNRSTFRQRILKAGISPRDISGSMYIRWRNATPAQASRMLNAAHVAVRRRKVSTSEKVKRAITRQSKTSHISPVEAELTKLLREGGYRITPQKAIGIYNVDLAIEESRVAVEIFGGGFHSCGSHAAGFFKRTKYLLNSGWHVIIVWVDGKRYPLGTGGYNYIVSFCKALRRNPSPHSQYRVILGDGNDAPAVKSKFNTPATIKRLSSG